MNDKPNCEATVWAGGGMGGFQCSRYGVIEDKGRWWCKQHSPAAKEARREASEEQWQIERAERDARGLARENRHAANAGAIEALRQIAAGHNDPSSLAQDAIAEIDKYGPTP